MARTTQTSATKGEDTKGRIIARALSLASSLGLEGVTIGELASDLGLSKSGLFAHFKSKEKLQLDILDAAAEHFRSKVFLPALQLPRGRPRLERIFQNWLDWVSSREIPGGCIFLAGALEWDDRGGPIRERLVSWFRASEAGTERAVQLAIDEGHLLPELSAAQFAFEMHGIVMKYHLDARLLRSEVARRRAEAAFSRLLHDACCA